MQATGYYCYRTKSYRGVLDRYFGQVFGVFDASSELLTMVVHVLRVVGIYSDRLPR